MARPGRPTVEIELTGEERETLQRWMRRHSSSQALALRSRIVLACAEGGTNNEIAARLGVNRATVAKWRHRFAADRVGLEGLADAPRPGAARKIGDDVVEAIVVETLETVPKDATHWSTRSLAAKHGISRQTVSEIWRAFGLKPWRQDEFKVSPDPDLVEKIRDIVGLYLNPPVAAAVFAIDEKPQIQALNRSAPTLPILPTTPARATHDYVRNGTVDLFAALEITTGKVITDLRPSHTSAEFVTFLNKVNREVPPSSTCTWSSTTSPPTRPRRFSSGCCGTSGSISTSPRPTARG
jgi:transposase